MTAVIRSALEEAMEAELTKRAVSVEARLGRLQQIVARSRTIPVRPLSDDELYDPATGLPW